MKPVIVHDFLNQYGGAEKVLEALHELYPEAPIFTSIFLPQKFPPVFSSMDVRTSFMQRLPFLDRHFKKYLPLYPRAVESFDLSGHDLVISSSSAFAKGARVPPGALHLCYCYTPMRFVWDAENYLRQEPIPATLRPLLSPALACLKRWDLRTAGNVHRYIAISEHIRRRIRGAYGRESEVIYPPVEVSRFSILPKQDDYFLVVSRLTPYKQIDLAIEAFKESPSRLLVIGAGPHERALKALAGKNVEFLGRVPPSELAEYMGRCRALVFPGCEDFGIAPVEAMACGRPVIAFAGGGALETVEEGVTGLFFHRQAPESLREALGRFEKTAFDPAVIRKRAERFDKEVFKRKIGALAAEALGARAGRK